MKDIFAEKNADRIRDVCREVVKRVTPSDEERRTTIEFSTRLVKMLECELRRGNIEADVQVEGSIAKDTWLAGDKDIDIFILIPKEYGGEKFTSVLEAAKRVSGDDYLEAYAEHPYIEAHINGFTVDFVPCFKVKESSEAKSSVDRTPLHTLYVKSRINEEVKNEIRLLKRFMHGIGVYGAEIKIGGFSGYLCEILTLHYGSFIKVLEAASRWCRGKVIDIEGYYKSREEARKIFQNEPLIVVDPVDKNRNAASAVRIDRLSEFTLASRLFLKKPNIKFFYPDEIKAYKTEDLMQAVNSRGTDLIFIKTGPIRAVPDILWGQLYKSQKALANLIKRFNFEVLRSEVWSDEKSVNIFIFELCSRFLPNVEKHIGPPIEKIEDCEKFLRKHLNSQTALSGPRVEGDRLIVEKKRRYVNVVDLLMDNLRNGGKNLGVASLISQAFKESLEILVNNEISGFYSMNSNFASFLTNYLIGKPQWLH